MRERLNLYQIICMQFALPSLREGLGVGSPLFLIPSGGVGGGFLLFLIPSGGVGGRFFNPPIAHRADVKSRPYLSVGQ